MSSSHSSAINFHDNNFKSLIGKLDYEVKYLIGGKLKTCYYQWAKITKDKFILDIIRHGLKLDQNVLPSNCESKFHPLSLAETAIITSEVEKLMDKQVVTKATDSEGFTSGVFTRTKKE